MVTPFPDPGPLGQERAVFGEIAQARTRYGGARSVDDKVAASNQLESALSRLLVIVSQYLRADPGARVQEGADLRDYRAHEASGAEKAEWWARATEVWPDYDAYRAATDREIPLFVLTR